MRITSIFFYELYEGDDKKEGSDTRIIFEASSLDGNLLTLPAFKEMLQFEEEVIRGDIWLNETTGES